MRQKGTKKIVGQHRPPLFMTRKAKKELVDEAEKQKKKRQNSSIGQNK